MRWERDAEIRDVNASRGPSKLVYLAPRPAEESQDAFIRRWRRQALSPPHREPLIRHELCGLLTPEQSELPDALFGPDRLALDFGGVGVAWFEDPAAPAPSRAALALPAGAEVHATREEVIFEEGGGAVRIFSFLKRTRELTLAEFSDSWRSFAASFLAHGELTRHCTSYVQDHVVEGAGESLFDGIAVMGFRDPAAALGLLSEPTLREELFVEEESFLDRSKGVVVLTRPEALAVV
jgi:hypothetical protein